MMNFIGKKKKKQVPTTWVYMGMLTSTERNKQDVLVLFSACHSSPGQGARHRMKARRVSGEPGSSPERPAWRRKDRATCLALCVASLRDLSAQDGAWHCVGTGKRQECQAASGPGFAGVWSPPESRSLAPCAQVPGARQVLSR